jgi:hypothetical protein
MEQVIAYMIYSLKILNPDSFMRDPTLHFDYLRHSWCNNRGEQLIIEILRTPQLRKKCAF